MAMYRHVLFASDLSKAGDAIGQKAKEIAEVNWAKISLVHVFTPFEPGYASELGGFSEALPVPDPSLEKLALTELEQQAQRLLLPDATCHLGIGSPKREIVRIAQENEVDLIVIGGHGLHGLEYILGSTADGVLHRTACDVLTVRVEG